MNKKEYEKMKKKIELKEKKHFFCKHRKNQELTVLQFKNSMAPLYFKHCKDCNCGVYSKKIRGVFQTNYQKEKRKKDKLWFLEQKLNYLECDLFPSEYVNQLDLTSEQKYILKIFKKALLNEMKKIKGE